MSDPNRSSRVVVRVHDTHTIVDYPSDELSTFLARFRHFGWQYREMPDGSYVVDWHGDVAVWQFN